MSLSLQSSHYLQSTSRTDDFKVLSMNLYGHDVTGIGKGEVMGGVMVGDRFRPTDQELVDYYLKNFILARGHQVYEIPIARLNFYSFEPSQLPGRAKIGSYDQEWYFISPLEYMDKKSKRFNRKTKNGTWKPTGNPRKVLEKGSKKEIGLKRTLVFHENNTRTEWVMHEYQYILDSDLPDTGKFVIIKLMRKPDDEIKKSKLNSCSSMNRDNEHHSESSMADDSPSSCESQSSVTELDYVSTTPFVLEDQSSDGKCSPERPLFLEYQLTTPESLPATYAIQLSPEELKEDTVPTTSFFVDDQSFNGNGESSDLMDCENDASSHNVVSKEFMIDIVEDQRLHNVARISPSMEGDWRDNVDLLAWINVAGTSEMGFQTHELMTVRELMEVYSAHSSIFKHTGDPY